MTRRRASGTLAELLGPGALPSDVQLRTLGPAARRGAVVAAALRARARGARGLRRGRERLGGGRTRCRPSTGALETDPVRAVDGARQDGGRQVDRVQPLLRPRGHRPHAGLLSYQAAFGAPPGCALFSEDLWRVAAVRPGVDRARRLRAARRRRRGARPCATPGPRRAPSPPIPSRPELAGEVPRRACSDPACAEHARPRQSPGSNQWAVSGRHTTTGRPLVANDPHLALGTPSTFYPIHLTAGAFDVMGSGFPGVPVRHRRPEPAHRLGRDRQPHGRDRRLPEQLVPDPRRPAGSAVYQGNREPIIPIPEVFRVQPAGQRRRRRPARRSPSGGTIPPVTLIVPRRNNGPIVNLDTATGAGAQRAVHRLQRHPRARHVPHLDTRPQPRRLRRRAAVLRHRHPELGLRRRPRQHRLLHELARCRCARTCRRARWRARRRASSATARAATSGSPCQHPQPGQAIPYEILPFAEMPQVVNPPAGWFVNANNDPAGTTLDNNPLNQLRPGGGLYYLSPGYDAASAPGASPQLVARRGRPARQGVASPTCRRSRRTWRCSTREFFVP